MGRKKKAKDIGVIKLNITDDQIERAYNLYDFDSLNGSITGGESQIYGALGEILVYDYFTKWKREVNFMSTYDYDMIIDGYKVDVKTKRANYPPLDNHLCSVSAWNIEQKCDAYFFVRVLEDLKTGYLLGFMGKDRFFHEAIYKKEGELDDNGYVFKDSYNVPISDLNKFNIKKFK